jgi:hypothetical protein
MLANVRQVARDLRTYFGVLGRRTLKLRFPKRNV